MNKLNKELLDRALVEGVDDSYSGAYIALASESHRYDGFHSIDNDSNDKFWQYVCTKEEYLAAKAEKEKPVYITGDNYEFSDCERFGHYFTGKLTDQFGGFFRGSFCDRKGEYFGAIYQYIRPLSIENKLEKPAQPVFTQAMADAGELPVVGMNCQGYVLAETKKQGRSCDKWVEGVFIQKSQAPNGGICFLFKCDNGHYYTLNSVSHFKPIDTRTDKEKALDELYKFFQENNSRHDGFIIGLFEELLDGKITGVKWVGK